MAATASNATGAATAAPNGCPMPGHRAARNGYVGTCAACQVQRKLRAAGQLGAAQAAAAAWAAGSVVPRQPPQWQARMRGMPTL